jgi:hypothetical protein
MVKVMKVRRLVVDLVLNKKFMRSDHRLRLMPVTLSVRPEAAVLASRHLRPLTKTVTPQLHGTVLKLVAWRYSQS